MSHKYSNCLGPPPRQTEIGYQGTYLSVWRLVLVSRALATAVPPTSPSSLHSRLQEGGEMMLLHESFNHPICLGPPLDK